MRLESILVATDFSPQAEAAVEQAITLARRAGAAVTLLHCEPLSGVAVLSAEPIIIPPQVTERLRGDRNRHLEEVAARISEDNPDLVVQPLLKSGEPSDGIVEAARHLAADLIVLGSHGAGGVDRFLLGSVTERVSRLAHCPVLVVRGEAEHVRDFGSVLVATDFSPFAGAQAEAAQALASPAASLELLHVWAPLHFDGLFTLGGAGPDDDLGRLITEGQAAATDALSALAEEIGAPEARTYVAPSTSASSGILDRARVMDADLIVVGAHDGTRLDNALGTNADRILRHADCPVLLVPELARARMDAHARSRSYDSSPAPS